MTKSWHNFVWRSVLIYHFYHLEKSQLPKAKSFKWKFSFYFTPARKWWMAKKKQIRKVWDLWLLIENKSFNEQLINGLQFDCAVLFMVWMAFVLIAKSLTFDCIFNDLWLISFWRDLQPHLHLIAEKNKKKKNRIITQL